MELSEKLFNLRSKKELTMQQAADAVGVSVRSITNYENGARTPKRSILIKLAELYDVELSELISNEENFLMQVQETDGSKGKAVAEQLLRNANSLFAGGDISEHDKEVLILALQESYWKSKEKNKKFTPKKYRKDGSDKYSGKKSKKS